MLTPNQQTTGEPEIFNAAALAGELEDVAQEHTGNERELRMAGTRHLKTALTRGRAAAEQLLIEERRGRRCAERLSGMQDEIMRLLYELVGRHLYPVQNPSEAERMAIIATGGYGRGVLAAGSD